MDYFKALTTFTRLVEAGSLSRVASQLNTTQSTISKRLAALEDSLGTKLITRSSRRQTTTEAGKIFYERSIQILELVGEAQGEVTSAATSLKGNLRIQTPTNFGKVKIVPIISGFLQKFPQIKIDLLVDNRNIDLIENGIDLAFRIGEQDNTSYITKAMSFGERFLVGSPDYFEEFGAPTCLDDLAQHNCLIDLFWSDTWQFNERGKIKNIHVSGNFMSNNADMIKDLAINGHGIGIFGTWSIESELASKKLEIIDFGVSPTPVPINAIYPDKHYLPRKVRTFIEFASEAFIDKTFLSNNDRKPFI